MRRSMCCKQRCFSVSCWLKLLAFVFVAGIFLQILQKQYTKEMEERSLKKRIAIDKQGYQNWQCDMNKQMVRQLQKELKEKNKLLTYRGRVIMGLRNTVVELNVTNLNLHKTILNLTQEVSYVSEESGQNSDNFTATATDNEIYDNVTTFEKIKISASKAARPCCVALNRMTDILRSYMEQTQRLQNVVAVLRKWPSNVAQTTSKTTIKHQTNSSTKANSPKPRRPEKYAVYQLYSKHYFYESIPLNRLEPKQKLKSKTFRRNHDFSDAIQYAIGKISKEHNLERKLFEVGDSIFRYDEIEGAVYHFTFVYNKTQKIQSDVVKPYTHYTTSKIKLDKTGPFVRKELINIVVSVSKRSDRLLDFLKNMQNLRKYHKENLFVTIVIYDTNLASGNKIKAQIKNFSKKYKFTGYDILKKQLSFNRGRALHDGIMRWNGYSKVLLFLCDVDFKIKPDFFNRCRQYATLGQSVYMPVIFSLYNPDIVFNGNKTSFTTEKAYNISDDTGTWRPYGYGMTCLYRPDYIQSGGFNLKINGWGGEDYSLYMRILKKRIKIIRSPDPALLHLWHTKYCSPSLRGKQYDNCLGSKARYEGSQRQLGILYFKNNCSSFTLNSSIR